MKNYLNNKKFKLTEGRVVGNFHFEHKKHREGFAEFVVENRLPCGFGDSQSINGYMLGYCQPAFRRIPRSILKSDVIKIYKETKPVGTA
jgi:hypothetical protein